MNYEHKLSYAEQIISIKKVLRTQSNETGTILKIFANKLSILLL